MVLWTGVSGNHNPISISGVYVNGILQTSGYSINYDAGKVIFDSAPSGNPIVRLEHSLEPHKYIKWTNGLNKFNMIRPIL